MISTGSAATAAYQQGALYANGEFIQVHPTAIPGEDKLRLMSESARGEGGRVWVPRIRTTAGTGSIPETERCYFLEERYPAYGNLVPRDIATRAIFKVCTETEARASTASNQVYLDLTHIPARELDRKLGGILEIYEKFVGEDPRTCRCRSSPAVHYSMGGLWVDYDQMTNIPGLFAAGECEYQYHGANRLGANSLLSCIYGGLKAADRMVRVHPQRAGCRKRPPPSSTREVPPRTRSATPSCSRPTAPENPFQIHHGTRRVDDGERDRRPQERRARAHRWARSAELKERFRRIGIHDRGSLGEPGARLRAATSRTCSSSRT